MSDQFRVTFPIPISFASGEQPSNVKLNSIATQSKNGLALVERALGDLWTQSGDNIMDGEPLQITNLARIVGQQKASNALMQKPNLEVSEVIQYAQSVVSQDGQTEIHLDFVPENTSVLTTSLYNVDFFNAVARDSIAADDDYHLDTINGIIYLGLELDSSNFNTPGVIEYEVLATNWPTDGSSESAYNVIPHPDMETDWKGIKFVRRDTNKYLAYLPPRRPLTSGASEIGKIPRASNNSVLPAASPVHRYWYTDVSNWTNPVDITADASSLAIATAKRYRHRLPELLDTTVTSGALGTQLPTGSLYLWDETNNTILEGITYRVPETDVAYTGGSRPGWVIQIEGAILDNLLEGVYDSTLLTDDPADYIQRFSLITVGEGVSEKTETLSKVLITGGSLGILPRDKHVQLLGLNPVNRGGADTFAAFPATYRVGDDHSYLLSREGSTQISGAERDRYNNAMLGDLLFGSSSSSTNYQNLTASSQKAVWGSMAGPDLGFIPDPGSHVVVNSSGSTVATGATLALGNNALSLDQGVVFLGNPTASDASGFYWSNPNLRVFSNNRVDNASISVGDGFFHGSAWDVSTTVAGSGEALNAYIHIDGPQMDIRWKGNNLDMSAETGEVDRHLRVGVNNSSTHLQIYNNRIILGTGITDYLEWSDASNTLTLYENGLNNVANIETGGFQANGMAAQSDAHFFFENAVNYLKYDTGTALAGNGATYQFVGGQGLSTANNTVVKAGIFHSNNSIPIGVAEVGADLIVVTNSTGEYSWKYNHSGFFFGGRAQNSVSADIILPLAGNPLWALADSGTAHEVAFGNSISTTIEYNTNPSDGDVDKFTVYDIGSAANSRFQAGTFIATGTNEVIRPPTTGGSTQYFEVKRFCYPMGMKDGFTTRNAFTFSDDNGGIVLTPVLPIGNDYYAVYYVPMSGANGSMVQLDGVIGRNSGAATTVTYSVQDEFGNHLGGGSWSDSISATNGNTLTSRTMNIDLNSAAASSGLFVVVKYWDNASATDWHIFRIVATFKFLDGLNAAGWNDTITT